MLIQEPIIKLGKSKTMHVHKLNLDDNLNNKSNKYMVKFSMDFSSLRLK